MSDTEVKKGFLRPIRVGLQWVLHVILILPVAGLKSAIAGLQYIHDELAKF